MTQDDIQAILNRVATWPADRQRQLAEMALDIEAEFMGAPYYATADELAAIDEGLAGDSATDEEVAAAFASFQRIPD